MITTPLAPIVAFLRRHKQGLKCLDGAPFRPDPIVYNLEVTEVADLEQWTEPAGELYLGCASICPAALGWATQLLALTTTFPTHLPALRFEAAAVELWTVGFTASSKRWCWSGSDYAAVGYRYVSFAGEAPTTHAERLKAVIEYEVSRD